MRGSARILSIACFFGAAMSAFLIAHPVSSDATKCVCETAKKSHGWCAKCNVGYVAGLKIPSALLFEEIDPHGHEIDPKQVECAQCQAAIKSDGYCENCKIGFVSGKAYMTKFTYYLAKAKLVVPNELTCSTCGRNAEEKGWCEDCSAGMIGPYRFTDRAQYESALRARRVVEIAIQRLPTCEVCAAAIVMDGYCSRCRIQYEAGRNAGSERSTQRQDAALQPHHATERD